MLRLNIIDLSLLLLIFFLSTTQNCSKNDPGQMFHLEKTLLILYYGQFAPLLSLDYICKNNNDNYHNENNNHDFL